MQTRKQKVKDEFLRVVSRQPDLYKAFDSDLTNAHEKIQVLQDDYCYVDPGDRDR